MARVDEIRLMAKVARMYYEQNIRQLEITRRLNIHQSMVSRILKRAREANLVRISVVSPPGIFSELEDSLEKKFKLHQAIVVDGPVEEEQMVRGLGAAAAYFLETTVKPGAVIGISSWSRSLFSMVENLHPSEAGRGGKVVQILGGVGNTTSEYHATELAQRLARVIGASAVLLQAPGVVGSAEAKQVLSRDLSVRAAADLFEQIDIALVGIGCIEPSKLLASSGNVFSPQDLAVLTRLGAVGDICMRFFDGKGTAIKSPLNNRVIGIELPALKRARQVVGVAGGIRKLPAIYAALLGAWINVLITDKATAEGLHAFE